MPTLSTAQWRTFCVVTAAVTAFLLTQPDGSMPLWMKLLVGCVNVAVAAILNPPTRDDR